MFRLHSVTISPYMDALAHWLGVQPLDPGMKAPSSEPIFRASISFYPGFGSQGSKELCSGCLIWGTMDVFGCVSWYIQCMSARPITLWHIVRSGENNMDGLRTRGRRLVPGGWWLVVCFFTAVLAQNAKVFENSTFEDLQVYTKVYFSR